MLKRLRPCSAGKGAQNKKSVPTTLHWFWNLKLTSKDSMGQKTNPIGNRLGIIRGWESNWYGGNDYGDKLAEDSKNS